MANALNTVSRSDINEALAYFRDREEHILSSITVERPDNDTTHVLDNCIVLMGGLPISSPNTHPMFTKFLLQRIANIEPNEHDVHSCYQPLNNDGTSKGIALYKCSTAARATDIASRLNGYIVDQQHTMRAVLLAEWPMQVI